ncbi:MAG: cation-transporting P-type ATPase [Myxococcales bacterium]|nr:cation-transporting P-type ATPase [Myxococcales bacterium]
MASPAESVRAWHAEDAGAIARELGVDPEVGLSTHEARARLERDGPNALPEPPRPHPLRRLLAQLVDPLVGVLLLAAIVAAVVAITEGSSFVDTIAILLIVVLNAVLGFVQERRAEAALAALRSMTALHARVIRDGQVVDVEAASLVVGDVLEVSAGDAMPADARLLSAVAGASLDVEEAALTGESTPVHKRAAARVEVEAPVSERANMLFTGTTVTRGRARAVVVATGAATELGRIGALLAAASREATPLEERLARLGRVILIVCVLISIALFVIGYLRGAMSLSMLLLTAVSLAVAAIPEGLPAITTITLALGMQRMAQRGAIVRRLPAVETLGSATVICTDKTGTLTQNAMTARAVDTVVATYRVTGEGYRPVGSITRASAGEGERASEGEGASGGAGASAGEATPADDAVLQRLLEVAVICNDAHLEGDEPTVLGDPTEGALLVLARKGGVSREGLIGERSELRVEAELPFDSDRKCMSVITRDAEGRRVAHVKGAPDVVLAHATRIRTAEGDAPMTDEQRERFAAINERHATGALRVLAFAERPLADESDDEPTPETIERDLTFLGLVAMNDPPRPEVPAAIAACRAAGIRVVMITGDHATTARAIARELGILEEDGADGAETSDGLTMTGRELTELDTSAFAARVVRTKVFARVTAEQKLRIVRALGAAGHVVAMTGDGVNDAPALREAPIGVAMGRVGTDVARSAAEMVLADDNFATLVHAVREGRAIYRNIQKFIFFLGSSNAGLVIAVLASTFFDAVPTLTPLQLLWINLVTNGLPALALGVDPPDPAQMREGPRPREEGIVGARDLLGTLFVGTIMAAAALSVAGLPSIWPSLFSSDPVQRDLETRTMSFVILAFSPLVHAFNCRSARESIVTVGWFGNRFLWLAVLVSAALCVVSVLVPSLRPIFLTHPLGLPEWGLVLGLAVLPLPLVEAAKGIERAVLRARSSRRTVLARSTG